MAENRITVDIDSRRLVRYYRIRWCYPFMIVLLLLLMSVWAAAVTPDANPTHPVIISLFTAVGATIVLTVVAAPIHVRSLKYWIDGTTLRIDQGIVERKCKSIPLDRVTDIEMVQGLLMRICGIWALRIQTAGSTDREPEGTIWGAVDVESVRDSIMTIRDKAAAKADVAT